MPGIIDPAEPAGLPLSPDPDDDVFAAIFEHGSGAVQLLWEQATRCPCASSDTLQPVWGCPQCGGDGVIYTPARHITGLFRSQSRWLSFRREGEFAHGEAQLTTPLAVKPGYQDRRIRDRFTVPSAISDEPLGRVFYPAAQAVPFIFNSIQRAWRVQLQSAELSQQLNP